MKKEENGVKIDLRPENQQTQENNIVTSLHSQDYNYYHYKNI